ncbi:hypothetical protein DAQ1742_02821 [Dickeya aquatica]|uniref:Uncharacterized protein n=1 Tax=Dickeya aquatica TaxID=1401087 RepID=A0A375AC80_9GAMM|nr:hypothetical protein DAQ1742_02821 [Dickeya aquatica]
MNSEVFLHFVIPFNLAREKIFIAITMPIYRVMAAINRPVLTLGCVP